MKTLDSDLVSEVIGAAPDRRLSQAAGARRLHDRVQETFPRERSAPRRAREGDMTATQAQQHFSDRAIEALEDPEDIASARAAFDKEGPSIPWEVEDAVLGVS